MEQAGLPFESVYTEHKLDATRVAKEAIESGTKKIIVVGGDGTLNEVVNGVMQQQLIPSNEVTLAIIPIGTGNDTIKTLRIPSDMEENVKIIKEGIYKVIDAGFITSTYPEGEMGRYFVNIAGMAFDAAVTYDANQGGKATVGKLAYLRSLLKVLFNYRSSFMRITMDGRAVEDKIFNLNVGNCKYAGGGMLLVPGAIPWDGTFHVTVVRDMGKWKVIKHVLDLFDGTYMELPEVTSHQATDIVVESDPPVYAEVEGELLGQTPIQIKLIPSALKIIMPQ